MANSKRAPEAGLIAAVRTAESPAAPNTFASTEQLFGFDWRSLAAFRIGIGLMTIVDVARRSLDFSAHYTNDGVLPAALALSRFQRPQLVSLYTLFDAAGWQIFLALLTVACAVAVMCGAFTRIAWLATWVLVLSIQHRNEWITNGGDVVFRVLFFWGAFLPLGARFSFDALFRKKPPEAQKERYFSLATAGLTFQIAFLYFFAAVYKSDRDWHTDGTAVFYALHLDKYATPLAVWLRQFPELLQVSTISVWYFEFMAPLFLFVPYFHPRVRMAVTAALMGMHVSFVACLRIGTFPWICIAGLSVLMPGLFWQLLGKLPPARAAVARVAAFGPKAAGRLAAPLKAYARVFDGLPNASGLVNVLAGLALLLVVIWNVGGIPNTGITLPQAAAKTSRWLGLDQHWDMFAPRPTRSDGWPVIPATTVAGKEVDAWYLDMNPVNWEKEQLPAYNYTSERWIKYFEAMYEQKSPDQIQTFSDYLCRRWNDRFPAEKLASLQVYYMDDPTLPTGKGKPIPVSLGKFACK